MADKVRPTQYYNAKFGHMREEHMASKEFTHHCKDCNLEKVRPQLSRVIHYVGQRSHDDQANPKVKVETLTFHWALKCSDLQAPQRDGSLSFPKQPEDSLSRWNV